MWRLFFRLLLRHNESAYLFLQAHPITKTYESAHSAIFIIFASHAQRQQHTGDSISDSSTRKSPTTATIVRNIPSNMTRTRSIGCVKCRTLLNKHGPEDERVFYLNFTYLQFSQISRGGVCCFGEFYEAKGPILCTMFD